MPITLVTLGAYFYRPSSSPPSTLVPQSEGPTTFFSRFQLFSKSTSSLREPRIVGERRTILVAVVSRMILVPLILLPLFGWYAAATTNVADDPVFIVVACLLIG